MSDPQRADRNPDMVAVDGSPAAERAVLVAIAEARHDDCAVIFVHVDKDAERTGAATQPARSVSLDKAMSAALHAGVRSDVRVLHGRAAEMIIGAADALDSRFIFVGANMLTGVERFILGSVAAHVVTHSDRPVFVIPAVGSAPASADSLFSRVLIPLEPGEAGSSIIEEALNLVSGKAKNIEFCAIVDEQRLLRELSQDNGSAIMAGYGDVLAAVREEANSTISSAIEVARGAGINAQGAVFDGEPANTIVRLALERDITSIVMATHGRTGLKRLFLGSTTDAVLRRTGTPVLTWRITDEPNTQI
jgi:nucleotide-binding universal stress UspA family protein